MKTEVNSHGRRRGRECSLSSLGGVLLVCVLLLRVCILHASCHERWIICSGKQERRINLQVVMIEHDLVLRLDLLLNLNLSLSSLGLRAILSSRLLTTSLLDLGLQLILGLSQS